MHSMERYLEQWQTFMCGQSFKGKCNHSRSWGEGGL